MPITGDWDQRITRRTMLRTGGSFVAGVTLAGTLAARASAQTSFASDPFALGVASGDPTARGMVLWTRIAPEPLAVGGGLPAEPYRVRYELARDEDFRHIVRHGDVLAVPDEAHSVRVELDQLPPAHEYFYRFEVGGSVSPVGRTRTGPPANAAHPAPLVFAFVSCQNFSDGYFTSYAEIAAAADIETVIFLGDYIYEGPNSDVRAHAPARTIMTLDDYRTRHAQYKTDVDLQAAHAAHPWLVTWDDHEFVNNYADMDVESAPAARGGRCAPRRRLPGLLGAHAAVPGAQAGRTGPAAVPALQVGIDSHLQRPRRPPVPLRPAGLQDDGPARRRRLLPGRPGPGAHACSAPSSATGCLPSSPPRARTGT